MKRDRFITSLKNQNANFYIFKFSKPNANKLIQTIQKPTFYAHRKLLLNKNKAKIGNKA